MYLEIACLILHLFNTREEENVRLLPRNEGRHCILGFFFTESSSFRATEYKCTHIFTTFVFIINPEKQRFRKILSTKQQTSQQQQLIQAEKQRNNTFNSEGKYF